MLYVSLSAILESNPFSEEDNVTGAPSSDKPTVDTVLSVYQTTLGVLQQYEVHPHIVSQLFSYLFFFTNTSLFNALMSKGNTFTCSSSHARLKEIEILLGTFGKKMLPVFP